VGESASIKNLSKFNLDKKRKKLEKKVRSPKQTLQRFIAKMPTKRTTKSKKVTSKNKDDGNNMEMEEKTKKKINKGKEEEDDESQREQSQQRNDEVSFRCRNSDLSYLG
jgi:hypothetical protein